MTSARRRGSVTVLAAGAAALLAACSAGSSATASGSGAAPGPAVGTPHAVTVTMGSDRCATDRPSYAAGGLTFTVVNKDATAVSEVEVLDGERIVAEKENVPPGFSGTFSISLQPATYTLYCPGATTERVPLTITGTATSTPVTSVHQLLVAGTKTYGTYVEGQVAQLVSTTVALQQAVATGDLTASRAAYDKARPYYERVEPVAESFQDLDPAIDNRADTVPVLKLTGFHRIEYGLFTQGSTAGLGPVAAGLVANAQKLQTLCHGLALQPSELANGAVELLDEVSKSKITGEEERYAHIDLLDFQANVEGSEQAFANLQPALAVIDPTLATTVAAAFRADLDLLDTYRTSSNPSGFVLYTSLSKADITKLAQSVQTIAEPLSRVASKVVNA